MTTLYFNEEVESFESKEDIKVNDKELKLALELINNMKGKFEPEKYKDEYQDNIRKAISKKLKGKKVTGPKKKTSEKINNLMEALEKSLNESVDK